MLPTSSSSAGTRERSLQFALLICLVDLCLMGSVAFHSTSITILGDLLKEFADTLCVLAAFLTLRAVRRSPDHRFAYGIGKLENLVSLFLGLVMIGSAFFITFQAAHHLHEPRMAVGTLPGIFLFALYTVFGYAIWFRTRLLHRQQPSAIMNSQSRLWFSKASFDALMGSALLVAYLFRSETWSWYLDPLASLFGVLFMVHAAWSMASSSVGDLLDATVEETTQLRILRQLVLRLDDYERLHKIRARRSGPRLYVEIFLEFDPLLLMGEVQKRINAIRQDLESKIPGADVSIRPSTTSPD
ncbi:MAG: cation diffusion facilitator family transporter [Verrucomicrobiota bacterium]